MMKTKRIVVGIDLGGTNTVFALVDEQGSVLHEDSVPTHSFDEPGELCDYLHEKVRNQMLQMDGSFQLCGVGLGAPNGNHYNGTIEKAPNLKWGGVINISQLLSERFGVHVSVTNDANAAALGEKLYGAAKNMDHFISITLGTGLGSGIFANGQLIHGATGFAGELGHITIAPNGRECGCGRKGCLETYASVTGIVRTAQIILAKSSKPSRLRSIAPDQLTGKRITDAAAAGDTLAIEVFDYTARRLGFSLANLVAITDPEAFILFGGLANAGDLLLEPTRKYMKEALLPIFKDKAKIIVSDLQEQNAAILGAAALAWQEIEKHNPHEPSLS